MFITDDFLSPDIWTEFSAKQNWNNKHSSFQKLGSTPDNIFDKVAMDVWEWYIEKYKPQNAIGIETWTNISKGATQTPLPWHRDRDEGHFYDTGENIHPIAGFVLYGHRAIPQGGYLEIKRKSGSELIEPVPNRLIVFDVSVWHRVTTMSVGSRYTMASNLWDKEVKISN